MAKVIQAHHIKYPSEAHPDQEWKVSVFKAEHFLLGRMGWYTRKDISLGFITALEEFVVRNKHRAIDLSKGEPLGGFYETKQHH